jgi:hypothetical protein
LGKTFLLVFWLLEEHTITYHELGTGHRLYPFYWWDPKCRWQLKLCFGNQSRNVKEAANYSVY